MTTAPANDGVVIVDPASPEMVAFAQKLSRRIQLYSGREFNDKLFRDVRNTVRQLVDTARRRGLNLPPLVPFLIRSTKDVDVFRADLQPQAIGALITYVSQRYGASADDISWALERAYPHFQRNALN